jgi:hypothetical protein
MKLLLRFVSLLHALIALLFVAAAVLLMGIALRTGWQAVGSDFGGPAALALIEAMGLIAVAVVALQIAQTILEEEVIREAHVSGPTRVRRFLSRFLVVVVVALSIEGLVATFKALHDRPEQLPQAATILYGVAALLAGWGVFIRLNRSAEELEPEAMQHAMREDAKVEAEH